MLDATLRRGHHLPMRQLSLIVLLACSACNARLPGQTTLSAPPQQSPLSQIHALIGGAACADSSQCKSLAVGASLCGGPESYLAYSTAATASAPLQEWATRYARQRNTELMNAGGAAACQFIVDPGAQCRAGACVLNPAPPPAKPRLRLAPEAATQ